MTRRLAILCAIASLFLASACGNKGPLYLPQSDGSAPEAAVTEHPDNPDPGTQPE